ncbi:MAG TPA: ATP-binding protein [Kofleriaceae bacterium]|nr:ATP-binding protein [Kofleriaceae bacterium]
MNDLGMILPALLDALDRAGVGVVSMTLRDGTVAKVYSNDSLARTLGYTPQEWLAAPLWHVIAPSFRPLVASLFERLARTPPEPIPTAIEVMLAHRDGHEMAAEVAAGRVEIPGGLAFVFVVRDMTLARQTHLSMLEADRLALVGALASGFAHETNNPLTSVLLNLRSMRKLVLAHMPEGAQNSALRCLDDITTGSERIASNVRALQTLATRSKSGAIDLASVVSSALRLAAPTLEPRAHVIRQIFPVSPVAGEESRIGQAVLAMLLFSSSGFDTDLAVTSNRITVVVEERGDQVVVEVSDNGRDLSPDEVQHAFDPFFRSPVRGAGVGVGLGVARSVAVTLGGEVSLTPRPGGGAVSTMRLPPAPRAQP